MSRTVATAAFPLRVYSCHAAILLPSSCSCCHVAVHHTLLCSYSSPLFECGYSCYHPPSPCHHVAILATIQLLLATMWLFLLPCGYSCHHVAIFAAMQPLIVAMWLFLLPCSYPCHHVAIFAAMQPLNCCHVAILAAVQLFLPPCGYFAAMQLFLPQCGYSWQGEAGW